MVHFINSKLAKYIKLLVKWIKIWSRAFEHIAVDTSAIDYLDT